MSRIDKRHWRGISCRSGELTALFVSTSLELCKIISLVLMYVRIKFEQMIRTACFVIVRTMLDFLFYINTRWCGFLYSKYYRAPRYRMRFVIIVFVEQRCTGCTNKSSSLLKTTYIYKDFNGVTYA